LVCEHSNWQFLAVSSNAETELLTAANGKHQVGTYWCRKSLRTLQNVTDSVMAISEISFFIRSAGSLQFNISLCRQRLRVYIFVISKAIEIPCIKFNTSHL
jgi:hypothetical protein